MSNGTVRLGIGVQLGQAVVAAWFLLPLVPLVLWSVAARWQFPERLPGKWGFQGWSQALHDGAFGSFGASYVVALSVGLLATCVGSAAAVGLARRGIHRSRGTAIVLFAPLALPPFVLVMGANSVLLRLGLPSPVGVVILLTVLAIPYTTFVMYSALTSYDTTVDDEARVLGASMRTIVMRIRLPILAPALSAAFFLAFLVGWSDYIVTVIVGGGQFITVPLRIASSAAGVGNQAVTAALSVAAILPPLLLLVGTSLIARRRRFNTVGRS